MAYIVCSSSMAKPGQYGYFLSLVQMGVWQMTVLDERQQHQGNALCIMNSCRLCFQSQKLLSTQRTSQQRLPRLILLVQWVYAFKYSHYHEHFRPNTNYNPQGFLTTNYKLLYHWQSLHTTRLSLTTMALSLFFSGSKMSMETDKTLPFFSPYVIFQKLHACLTKQTDTAVSRKLRDYSL